LSPDPNRQSRAARSSKKRRAVQAGTAQRGAATDGTRVPPQRPRGGAPRGGSASSGIPTAWLAVIAVVVFAVGVALAGGVFNGGGGAPRSSSTTDAFGFDASGAAPSVDGQATILPGGSPAPTAGGASAPGGSVTGGGIPAGCPTSQPPAAPAGQVKAVTIDTPQGAIEITLTADLSPIAVGNFLALASCGYYDTVVFHRVVQNFVIQGGDGQFARQATYDPSRAGTGGPGYEIQDEPVTTQYSRGTVAMARTAAPNSVGSQFFIVLSDDARTALASANTYQIIGSVTKGMEAADAIAAAADAENPSQPVPMTKLTVAP
jgi:peptidyl-prolyl cis-trans isomerase B (cyclophilin B)